ncbi:MAG TPA: hypothetical protein VGR28_03045 [Candidatus Thermoplasmatota archaeon]|nr:hypothetical protein [Candidatus Thermoplasmatota archaeon]
MVPMPLTKEELEEWEAEGRAIREMADRVARDDPDWGLYMNPADKPKLPWWRRLLKL